MSKPEHFDLGKFVDYVHGLRDERDRLKAELAALRATHPAPASVGGVEVVEVVCITQGGCNVTWTATKELTPAGTALMSVRQHNRIMAATVPAGSRVVPVELLELIEKRWRVPNGHPKSVPEHAEQMITAGLSQLRACLR